MSLLSSANRRQRWLRCLGQHLWVAAYDLQRVAANPARLGLARDVYLIPDIIALSRTHSD